MNDLSWKPESDLSALPEKLRGGPGGVIPAGQPAPFRDDLEAMRAFLEEYQRAPNTLRRYRTELERLALWSWRVRNKPVSALDRQDYRDYEAFLADPQPAEMWCGPRRPRYLDDGRRNPEWRPFAGPLSPSSINDAMGIIRSFLGWLVDAGYLERNPMALRRLDAGKTEARRRQSARVANVLDPRQWALVLDTLNDLPDEKPAELRKKVVLRYIFIMLYMTGVRIGELARRDEPVMVDGREIRNTHAQIWRERDQAGNEYWWLTVYGKGRKPRDVPLAPEVMEAVREVREVHDYPALPEPNDDFPLLPSIYPGANARGGLTTRGAHRLITWLFEQAALRAEDPADREHLRSCAAHTLRHTSVTEDLDAGVDPRIAMEKHGHANLQTTLRYSHARRKQLQEAARLRKPE